jgi:Penicillin-insensitive murein endopeptidase/Zinc carboxypeptidase
MVARALTLAALALAGGGWTSAGDPPSRSLGVYWDGQLVNGVRLPAEGRTFFTWDPVLRRSPNRDWRRFGSDRLVRVVLGVLDDFAAAHPEAPRIGIGDLSRPSGGDFGPSFGGFGHVSHQNGLDADIYYPRRDRRERAARRVAQVDRRLAQELVDHFVRAGVLRVFVGPNVGLRGPGPIVQRLPRHDDHMHIRLPLTPTRRWENAVSGHTLRLPAGWVARADRETAATHVSTARPVHLGRVTDPPPKGGTRIWLYDYRAVRSREAQRDGAPLRLGPASQFEGFGASRRAVFRVGRHVFVAFVKLHGDSQRVREQAVALLESVRLTPFGRAAANLRSSRLLGRSADGRPIHAFRTGNPQAPRRILVVGCIHGDECAGMAVTRRLLGLARPIALDLWLVQNLNPDGLSAGTRGNARGVDLNRDFDTFSQPETRIARRLIGSIRPDATIWFHQPQGLVRAWGASRALARRYARLAGERYRSLRWPPGAATRWQNGLGQASFVVELPAGELPEGREERHADAILRLVAP